MRMRGRYFAAQSALEATGVRAFAQVLATRVGEMQTGHYRHAQLVSEIHAWLVDTLTECELSQIAALGLRLTGVE